MNTDTKHKHASAGHDGAQHEKSDFDTDFVWSFAWSLLGLMAAGLVISFLLFAGYNRYWLANDPQPSRLASSLPARPPEPRLQDLPAHDLVKFREREKQSLENYGWVEPAAGVVRLPIERAMELTLERGLPARVMAGNGERGMGKENSNPAKRP